MAAKQISRKEKDLAIAKAIRELHHPFIVTFKVQLSKLDVSGTNYKVVTYADVPERALYNARVLFDIVERLRYGIENKYDYPQISSYSKHVEVEGIGHKDFDQMWKEISKKSDRRFLGPEECPSAFVYRGDASLARDIANKHKDTIKVESKVKDGSAIHDDGEIRGFDD